MLWLIARTITSEPWSNARKPLLACALDCACTVQHLWPTNSKIGHSIQVLRDWIEGTASKEEARQARTILYVAAAYAVDYAAAYAGTYSAAAAAAAPAAATDATEASAAASYASEAYVADAKTQNQLDTANIVRRHFPKPPRVK